MKALKVFLLGLFLVITEPYADDTILGIAIENARISPLEAMDRTIRETGGKLEEFSVDDENNRLVYKMTVIDNNKGLEIDITMDADNGTLTETDRDGIDSWSRHTGQFENTRLSELFTSELTLQSAVRKALDLVPGHPKEAELEFSSGLVYFEIEILTDRDVKEVIVDFKSGSARVRHHH